MKKFVYLVVFSVVVFSSCSKKEKEETTTPQPPSIQSQLIYGTWESSGAKMCSILRMYFFLDGTWKDSTCWCMGWISANANSFGHGTFYVQNDSLIKFTIMFSPDTIIRQSWKITELNNNNLRLVRSDCFWSWFTRVK